MLVGVLATVLGCLLHTWAAVAAARLNFGSRFPYLWGMYPVRPTRRVKRAQTAGCCSALSVRSVSRGVVEYGPWTESRRRPLHTRRGQRRSESRHDSHS